MKPFKYFLETNEVKKTSQDKALASSLIKDMLGRIKDVSSLDISKFPKIEFENIYDSLRDFADAVLAIEGFKSYSHQASFSYLKKFDFAEETLETLDRFRYKRNGSKYYGQIISEEEAKEIFEFYKKIKNKIEEILKSEKLI